MSSLKIKVNILKDPATDIGCGCSKSTAVHPINGFPDECHGSQVWVCDVSSQCIMVVIVVKIRIVAVQSE